MTQDNAVKFAAFAMLMYDAIAAVCSSPQTAEINADKRADTLMKWVHLGILQGAGLVVLGAYIERKGSRWPILLGGGIAGVIMYAQYYHAREAGLASMEEGTED